MSDPVVPAVREAPLDTATVVAEPCWFEGTAFQSKPGFRVERHGEGVPEWAAMTPPPGPGEWRWEGTKLPNPETPSGVEMVGTWTKLPVRYPLVRGMVVETPSEILIVRKAYPRDAFVTVRYVAKEGSTEGIEQVVSFPRELVEETVRLWPPKFIPGVTPVVEVQPTPEG